MRRTAGRVVILLVLVVLAAFTYPGAILVSLAVHLTPSMRPSAFPVTSGGLDWLHVEHGAGTPYIADQEGRRVLLHGAIPTGLIDFWSGTDYSVTNTPPYYPIDPAAYDNGKCPSNSSVIATPPLCQKDIERMAALGFNSVRLPMSWSLLEPERGKFNQQYLDRVAQVVGWARAVGLYVILDMHQNAYSRYVGRSSSAVLPGSQTISLRYYTGAPDWATFTDGLPSVWYSNNREVNPAVMEAATSFWYDRAGIQDEYIATVARVMQRFKDDSTVAGISVYNEPWPGWDLSPGFEDLLLFPFYRRVIDAITGLHDGLPCPTHVFMPAPCGYPDLGVHDTRHLVFLDTGLLREITDFPTHLGLPVSSYPNLVLGMHAYTHIYTIEHLIDPHSKPQTANYPWGGYDQSYYWGEREARAIGAALFVTEFGNDPLLDSVELVAQLREQEMHMTGFAFWLWMENCGGGGDSKPYGVFDGIDCSTTAAEPSSGCIRPGRAVLLARVYPEASSDPNLTYSYDPKTGFFTMHATARFGDAPTVVVVPAVVTGSVTVGGAVAGEPSIAQTSDGGRIVTVFPGGGDFTVNVAAAPLAQFGC
ncbi:MAG TPA: cellulase family glycosylhydrolase [Candidatus Dormibacteraeota bacterium]|nr:cellulase family glycosylhydrolase [Candidatus Dormibacteraeota bacterium]